MKVLYIVGRGRSGSTVLSYLLGQHPDIMNVGELKNFQYYFKTAVENNRTTLDGFSLLEHPFWIQIREDLKEKLGEEFPDLKVKDQKEFESYNGAIFEAISEHSGKAVILDASKKFLRLRELLRWKRNDIYVIHMVRDPRAYVYSCLKNQKLWRLFGLSVKIFDWNFKNLYLLLYLKIKARYVLTLKYEEFVASPVEVINRVVRFAGANSNHLPIENASDLQPSFSGNANFHKNSNKGRVILDTDYIQNLSAVQWYIFSIFSYPTNLFFQYPFNRQKVMDGVNLK